MILNRVLEFNVSAFGIKTSSVALIRAFGGVTADLQHFLLSMTCMRGQTRSKNT